MFYKIRYVIKNAGSQVIFWDNNSYLSEKEAIEEANNFLSSCQKETLVNTDWYVEKDILKRKLVYITAEEEEEMNFSVHVSIGKQETVPFSAK